MYKRGCIYELKILCHWHFNFFLWYSNILKSDKKNPSLYYFGFYILLNVKAQACLFKATVCDCYCHIMLLKNTFSVNCLIFQNNLPE